jgi:hypothetical protein
LKTISKKAKKHTSLIFRIVSILLIISGLSCKSTNSASSRKIEEIKYKYKFVLYPIISEEQEFSNKLLLALKEVIEYNFSQEVVLQNYIPQTDENINYDLDRAKAVKAIICHLKSLELFYPQKIYFRCYVFKRANESQNIDITKKLLQVKEEQIEKEKTAHYKYFDTFIDLADKADLEEAISLVQKNSKEKVFLAEHLFLKQDNFLLVIKQKFAHISKEYLFDK